MPRTSSYSYALSEALPSAPFMHSGRGGAGNVTRKSSQIAPPSSLSHPISPAATRQQQAHPRPMKTGRGGAGNFQPAPEPMERAMFSFDEELEQQLRVAPIYHVGRGGAGNAYSANAAPSSSSHHHNKKYATESMDPHKYRVHVDGSIRPRDDSDSSRSDESSHSLESGADAAARKVKNGLEKGWKGLKGVGNYMVG